MNPSCLTLTNPFGDIRQRTRPLVLVNRWKTEKHFSALTD